MKKEKIIKSIVTWIESTPVGSTASIRLLSEKFGAGECFDEDDLFSILDGVEKTLKKHGKRRIDFHEYDGLVVGLPYNIEFVIRDAGSGPEFDYLVDWHFPDVE